ncbi:MAG TPA: hypothetical protein VFW19_09900 [Allosphingosinicella sp.]|nr:hypothetical protein [Allosphingosinicella sp.]
MASDEEVSNFIGSSFRSVWSLELLLLLKRAPRLWSRAELVAALRASDLIVAQGLDALAAAGLVVIDEAGNAAYRPASDGLAELAEGTESLYARSPDAVRRLIVGAIPNPLTAFADAFRLRKE